MVTSTRIDPFEVVATVNDPELPFVSIVDLGIVRGVEVEGDLVTVTITPTYSGCPAMETIKTDLVEALTGAGFQARIETVLNPPWTTDHLSAEAHRLLAEAQISPPNVEAVCPRCRAAEPRTLSFFGSTACKALMVCTACGEPFDTFKEHR